jgi:flagellar biosynthesis protein FlhB
VAEDNDMGDRTEEATSQRREDYRKRGQVAHTKEFATVLILFGGVFLLWSVGHDFILQISSFLTHTFTENISFTARTGDIISPLKDIFAKGALVSLPIGFGFMFLGVASQVLQTGFLSKENAIQVDFSHVNPIQGLQRLFTLRAVVEGIKACLKFILITSIVYVVLKEEIVGASRLSTLSVPQLGGHIALVSGKLLMSAAIFILVLAVFDYGYQRWSLEQQMRMTKQEVKEEIKNREGDPQTRARIRRIQRDVAQRRMMDAVKKADVIITNPTHIAVAIRYEAGLPAPQLLAKGAELIAEKIKARARELGIPIVENKPLARTIFKTMKIGQVIPRELFNAVAEVLAYVYKLKRKKKAR